MIAARNIEAGTRILQGELLASVKDDDIDEYTRERIRESREDLSPERQEYFGKLHSSDITIRKPPLGWYRAEYFDMDLGRSRNPLQASCVNHSCCAKYFFLRGTSVCAA